jgi:hypothetical protein
MAATDSENPRTAPGLPDSVGDGFKETPTAPQLMTAEECVLARLLQIQAELAELCEKQKALLQSSRDIESSVAQAFLELKQLHSDAQIADAVEAEALPNVEHFKSAKTSVIPLRRFEEMDAEAAIPDIDIPGDDDWNRWKSAWDAARSRAEKLTLPRLPSCPTIHAELEDFLRTSYVRNDDPQLREFFARFGHYLEEYERGIETSKLYTACRSLNAALKDAQHIDAKTDTQIERAEQALGVWQEKTNAQHRWFADDFFDAELTETLTVAYDCLASLQIAQPQLVCEQLRHACDWLLYFLTLLGVHKDSGLQIGVLHEQLPRHLRDKFPVQSLKSGRSADACKIVSIIRNRWYRIAENREIQVVRPWYELN